MKANELSCKSLMIGDWVMINPISYYQVEQIRIEFGELRICLKDTEVFATENDIMPIPLTPEILEKNGFLNDGVSFWYKDFRIVLSTSKGVSLVCGRLKIFEFVHELQHALRLCGIEKEIIL